MFGSTFEVMKLVNHVVKMLVECENLVIPVYVNTKEKDGTITS
jgi:hypothetical protein